MEYLSHIFVFFFERAHRSRDQTNSEHWIFRYFIDAIFYLLFYVKRIYSTRFCCVCRLNKNINRRDIVYEQELCVWLIMNQSHPTMVSMDHGGAILSILICNYLTFRFISLLSQQQHTFSF